MDETVGSSVTVMQGIDPLPIPEAAERSALPGTEGVEQASGSSDISTWIAVHLRVLEKGTDRPLSGARVESFDDSAAGVRETDAKGECAFRVPMSEDSMLLRVERDGYFHAQSYCQRWEELEIRLYRSAVLSGRVLDVDTGLGVPGVRIHLGHGTCKRCDHGFVVSGPEGEYELASVPLRSDLLWFSLEADAYPEQSSRFEIRSDEPRVERDFRIQRGREVSGHVVDFVTGTPISGASVAGSSTDSNGAFHGWVEVGEHDSSASVRIEASGYCRLDADVELEALRLPLEFRVPRPTAIEGLVHDAEGLPVAGVGVWVSEDGSEKYWEEGTQPAPTKLDELPAGWKLEADEQARYGSSDEKGHFRIESVVPWSQRLVLKGEAEGFEFLTSPIERVGAPGEVTWLELVIERKAPETRVSGSVWLNGTELHAAQGEVCWTGPTRSGDANISSGDFDALVEPGAIAFRVEVEGLPSTITGCEFEKRVEPGTRAKYKVELRMPVSWVSGRVLFGDGSPAVGARVTAGCPLHGGSKTWNEQIHVAGAVDSDGSHTLEVPDWDRLYRVIAEDHHDNTSMDAVRPGTRGVDLVLSVPGRVLVRIVEGVTRSPVDRYHFRLGWKRADESDFHNWFVSRAPDSEGWFEEWIPSGRLDLQAQHSSSEYQAVLFRDAWIPPSGEPPRLEFSFE